MLSTRTEEGKKLLDKYKLEAKSKHVVITTELKKGDPAMVILEVSKEQGHDTIILGTRGLGHFKRLVLGRVSNKIVHHSSSSVLLIR